MFTDLALGDADVLGIGDVTDDGDAEGDTEDMPGRHQPVPDPPLGNVTLQAMEPLGAVPDPLPQVPAVLLGVMPLVAVYTCTVQLQLVCPLVGGVPVAVPTTSPVIGGG